MTDTKFTNSALGKDCEQESTMTFELSGDTGELDALARRAVACKRWRWMPGMADCWGGRVRECDGLALLLAALPDLTDPATLGCLLALVREAFPAAPAAASRHSSWEKGRGHYYVWIVSFFTGGDWKQSRGPTEAAALVAALEAAP